ncbi:MAG: hypothetical protein NTU44_09905 [Bacteroidetes bacterium]|nr:hypothetical protein [Bacteroidota bacterium]
MITYTYTDGNGCVNSATNNITVFGVPSIYALTGNGSYCQGSVGLTITLGSSQTGISYQLYKGGTPSGSPLTGNGISLTWTGQSAGVYTAVASNPVTSCSSDMAGTVTITEIPLPTVFAVGGAGSYCHSANGRNITLSGSQIGVSYQLVKNGVNDGDPVAGTGSALSWPNKTAGTYTVVATPNSSSCVQNMSGLAVVTQDPVLVAGISPSPAFVLVSTPLGMNGNPAGGTAPFTNHAWTGTGASSLSSVSVVNPIFTNAIAGDYTLTYTVTDAHSCTATSNVMVHVVTEIQPPTMNDQMRCGTGSVLMTALIGNGGDQVEFSLDGSTVVATDGTSPYEYSTPPVTAGTSITVYARTKNSASSMSSTWVSATAFAFASSIGGIVSGGNSICLGSATQLLQLAGHTGLINKWQKRVDGGAWTDIANTNTSYSETPSSAGTWDYRAEIQVTGCSPAYSTSATVGVAPLSVAGTLSIGSGTICLGSSTGPINLTDQTGTVLSWHKRLNGLAWQPIDFTGSSYSEIPASVGFWEYQAEVQSGVCPSVWSASIGITVSPGSVGGQVTGGTVICPSTSTATLQLSGQTGAVVNWQKRLDGGSWIDISNTLTTYAEIPFSSGTWDYRAVIQNNLCPVAYSVETTVTVLPVSIGGQVNGGGTICQGSSTGTLSLVLYNNNIHRWQKRLNGGIWTDITNTQNTYSEVPSSTGTWEYRGVVGLATCTEVFSVPATVVVVPATAGGAVTADAVICAGGNSGLLTLSGQTGTVLKWQSSVSPFTVWDDIVNTAITYASGSLSQTTRFRAVVKNGDCSEAASSPATITVNPLPNVLFSGTLAAQCIGSTTYLLTGGTPSGGTYTGTGVSGTNFNASLAGSGNHVITYTYTDNNGCTSFATNTITVNPLPSVSFPGPLASQCATSTTYGLSGATPPGGIYSGNGVTGSNFNASLAGTGTHLITYTYTDLNGCTNSAGQNITVNASPALYNLSESGHYCQGSGGLTLALSGSNTGVMYQLVKNGSNFGSVLPGTGSALNWTGMLQGSYTVVATMNATSCQATMTGTVTLTEDPLPTVYTVSGSGAYCYSAAGRIITLLNSQTGVAYQLKKNGTDEGASQAGTGTSLTWPDEPFGTYTVQATILATGCSATMGGTIVITRDAELLAAVIPNPANVIAGNNLVLTGLSSGGTGTTSSHLWSGAGAAFLSSVIVQNPIFNCPTVGNYVLTYTVTDSHGCTATVTHTVHVISQVQEPVMDNQIRCGSGTLVMEAIIGAGGDQVQFSLDGSTVIYTSVSSPYTYTTPVVNAGNTLNVYARTRNSSTGVTSTWVMAQASAYSSSVGGSISGSGDICLGSSTPVLHLSGQVGAILGWQKMLSGGSWVNIANTSSDYSEVPGQTGTWLYRAEVQIAVGGCPSVFSSSATVVVSSPSSGGTLAGSVSALCLGTATAPIVLSGNNGSVVSWRKRLNNSVWQTIAFTGTSYSETPALPGVWDYQAEVRNGSCGSAYSSIFTLQVDAVTVGGSVSGSQTICPSTSTPLMTLSGQTGSVLKWQKQLSPGSWTDIAFTGISYSETPGASGTWNYRAVVRSGVCQQEYSSMATIIVLPLAVGGQVSGDAAICQGSSTGTLTLTGFTGTILGWQKRVNGGGWISISNALTTYSETVTDPGTWEYRAIVDNGSCQDVYSTPATIIVTPSTVGGKVNPDATKCSGQNSGLLTLANFTGSIIKWQYSVAPFSSWTDITNTSSTYTSGMLTQTIHFRAVVKNGVCQAEYSEAAVITVVPLPTVTFPGSLPSQCINALPYTFNTGSPSGGTYSGTGVTGGIFTPSVSGTGSHLITYTYADVYGCVSSATNTIQVNPLPVVVYNGTIPNQCLNNPAITLTGGSPAGGTYSGPGVSGNSFTPAQAGTGLNTITYTYSDQNGCVNTATTTVTVQPMPVVYAMGGNGHYCQGGTGLPVSLSGSQTGVSYQLLKNGVSYGIPQPGTGNALVWTSMTAGSYTAVATYTATGCSLGMTGSAVITQDLLPAVYNLSGTGQYCYGSGGTITLSGSELNVSYQLKKNGVSADLAMDGTGSAISWTGLTAGSYTVTAIGTTSGCTGDMTGTAVLTQAPAINVTVLPDPANVFINADLVLTGQANGGSGTFTSSLWSGSGAAYLTTLPSVNPATFNSGLPGDYTLTFTVTDSHGCTASAGRSIHVSPPIPLAVMYNSVRCGDGSVVMVGVIPYGGNEVQFSLDGITVVHTDNSPPYTYTTPSFEAGDSLMVYARIRNSTTGFTGEWMYSYGISFENTVAGTTIGGGPTCMGYYTPQMEVVGFTGTVLKWQKRLLPSNLWTIISSGESVLSDLTTAPGTWEYRAVIQNAQCMTLTSTPTTVVVSYHSVGGEITSTGSAYCMGAVMQPLILYNDTGTVVGWRKRLNGSSWQSIINTSHTLYDTASAVGFWDYQALVNNGSCGTAFSVTFTVTVQPPAIGGILTGSATICQGDYTPLMQVSGYSGMILKWQKRFGSGSWTDVINTASTYSELPSQTGTWQYRVVVDNSYCAPQYSSVATVVLLPANLGGVVNGGGNVCQGSTTGFMTLTNYSGTIQKWQRKHDNGPWTDILVMNSYYSEVPNGTGTWTYRVVIGNPYCGTVYSAVAVVVVFPPSVGGSISGSSVICQGNSTGTMTLSGYTGNVMKWQRRLNGGSWADIVNSSFVWSEVQNSAGTWEYRAAVQSGLCSVAYSSPLTITVTPVSLGGVVTGGTSFCLGNSTGILSLTGYIGSIIKWQKRVNAGIWTDISNTSAEYSETPVSAGNWEYRAVVQNGSCSVMFANAATVTVNANPLVYSLSGPPMYCEGSSGVTLVLSGSETGVGYQLKKDGLLFGFPKPGTGSPLQWANMSFGQYTVTATKNVTLCSADMTGQVTVVQMPLPGVYSFGPSGYDCGGFGGGVITLSSSQPGIQYQLYRNNQVSDLPQTGTGQPVVWGALIAGTYTITAMLLWD